MNLSQKRIEERIGEFLSVRPLPGHSKLTFTELALFLEETFDLSLSDEEISAENLGNTVALCELVRAKLGG